MMSQGLNHTGNHKKDKQAWRFLRRSTTMINKFFKNFSNHRKKTNRAVVFSQGLLPNTLK